MNTATEVIACMTCGNCWGEPETSGDWDGRAMLLRSRGWACPHCADTPVCRRCHVVLDDDDPDYARAVLLRSRGWACPHCADASVCQTCGSAWGASGPRTGRAFSILGQTSGAACPHCVRTYNHETYAVQTYACRTCGETWDGHVAACAMLIATRGWVCPNCVITYAVQTCVCRTCGETWDGHVAARAVLAASRGWACPYCIVSRHPADEAST